MEGMWNYGAAHRDIKSKAFGILSQKNLYLTIHSGVLSVALCGKNFLSLFHKLRPIALAAIINFQKIHSVFQVGNIQNIITKWCLNF